jgi:hypothetical protein
MNNDKKSPQEPTKTGQSGAQSGNPGMEQTQGADPGAKGDRGNLSEKPMKPTAPDGN